MDLTDILRKRTAIDLEIATARALEISLEIEVAAAELRRLRSELKTLESSAEAKRRPDTPITPPASTSKASFRKRLRNRIMRLRAPTPQLRWNLDEIGGVFPPREKGGVSAAVSKTSLPSLTLSGWVVPIDNNPAFTAVGITLTGRGGQISRDAQTYPRADVAAHFGDSRFISCGFRFEIPMFEIPVGEYDLEISGHEPSGKMVAARAGTIEVAE